MIETAQAPNELLGVRFSTVPRVWSRLPVARPQEPVTRPQLPFPWGRLHAAPHPDVLLVLPLVNRDRTILCLFFFLFVVTYQERQRDGPYDVLATRTSRVLLPTAVSNLEFVER